MLRALIRPTPGFQRQIGQCMPGCCFAVRKYGGHLAADLANLGKDLAYPTQSNCVFEGGNAIT